MQATLTPLDDGLSAAAAARDDEPLRRAFQEHYGRLRAFVRRQIGDSGDVEDIVQDVFYELILAHRLMQPIGRLAAWMMRVARNRIIDRFRARGSERGRVSDEANVEPEPDRLLETLALPDACGPEADYARAELADVLAQALSELAPEQREVFLAHEIEGRSFKQLADSSGVGINTLLGRKHAAVRHLRERLHDIYEDSAT